MSTVITCGERTLDLSQPTIMGVLNVTPDSFSDGGMFVDHKQALKHVEMMIDNGVDIIDIGAESSRPGAKKIQVDEERKRRISRNHRFLKRS